MVQRFDAQRNPSTDSRHTAVVEHLLRQERNIKDEIDLSGVEFGVLKFLVAVALDRTHVLDISTCSGRAGASSGTVWFTSSRGPTGSNRLR